MWEVAHGRRHIGWSAPKFDQNSPAQAFQRCTSCMCQLTEFEFRRGDRIRAAFKGSW